MNILDFAQHRELIIASMAAFSVFFAFVLVTWPYLVPDTLSIRMRQVAGERERIRVRERERLSSHRGSSLKSEPKRLFKAIVGSFNLANQTEDSQLARKLLMAGYRGRGPVVAFVAIRLVAPFAAFALAVLYLFFVLDSQQPFFVKLAAATAAACIGYYAPAVYLKNKISKRQTAIRQSWPDALDLLLICVESGMGIESALHKVSDEIGSQCVELTEELSLTTAELSYLQDRRKAYENLGLRTDLEGVKAVVTSLIQSERYGTPLGNSLRVLAEENRNMRMAAAEQKAAALPPKLTVPMIIFFLPVLFVVIITPAIIQIAEVW